MGFLGEIALRLNLYKNRAKLNYLLSTNRWVSYYCKYQDENTLLLPKIRPSEVESKLPKTIKITSKPCFNETNKIVEYHALEGMDGTIDWFGKAGSSSSKEDRRRISSAIEAGERIAKTAQMDLFGIMKQYANWFPILMLVLQLATLAGIYVVLNP